MHPNSFKEGLLMITQVFGEAPIKGPRLARIKAICEGRVSDGGFIEICESICDSIRHIPLPSDFEKAVSDWRKHYYLQHGRYYSENDFGPLVDIDTIDCLKCLDVGLVRITHRNPSDFESLMRCTCGKVSELQCSIPEWDAQLSGAYNCKPCPAEWFKPEIKETDSDARLHSKIWERVSFFKNKQKQAIKHWISLGFKKDKVS